MINEEEKIEEEAFYADDIVPKVKISKIKYISVILSLRISIPGSVDSIHVCHIAPWVCIPVEIVYFRRNCCIMIM